MSFSRAAISLVASLFVAQTGVLSVEAKPGFYLSVAEFLDTVFESESPAASSMIVNGALRKEIEQILDHGFSGLRIEYWQHSGKSAWVLDEIGKTEPITFGVAIDSGRVGTVRVLEYRESRGSEIRHSYFTDQFLGSTLSDGSSLDRSIDSITGATLSVTAAEKVVRVALLLDRHVAERQGLKPRASY
jgi:hypothetical protein